MFEKHPRISIVTATYNQGPYIEDCILSIISQKYPNLEYIILDGGSTDNTLEVIKKYEQHIAYWVSEQDGGMYDAINRGLQKTSGEIMGWLNSDDFLVENSLFTLAQIFSDNAYIEWLQGHPCVADETGKIVFQRQPRSSKYSFLLKDYKDGIFIQQESTFWRRSLWEKAGSRICQSYRFAGDFELWMRFYKYAEQYTTEALLGVFRVRQDQLSAKNYNAYLEECDQIIDSSSKDLTKVELSKLRKIRIAKKRPLFFSLLKKMGVFNGYFNSIEEKPLSVRYVHELKKFVKAE